MRWSIDPRSDFEDLFRTMWGADRIPSGRLTTYEVPTDVFHTEDSLVIRMDLPQVAKDDIEVTVQENVLVVNGTRRFPYDLDKVRFLRRGTFYGDFTQRISLGKGLEVSSISAEFTDGVLELKIPYAEEVQPRKIEIAESKQQLPA